MPKPKSTRGRWTPSAIDLVHFKVTLQHTRPAIWRRIVVPDNMTLGGLHDVIQVAMGWTNSHLHSFQVGDQTFGMMLDDVEDGDLGQIDEDSVTLRALPLRKGLKFTYEYDFGDSWSHTVAVEKLEPATAPHPRPACLDGRRACPPEDCGGVWGYGRVLQVLKRTKTADDREFREWVGDYDPEAFDLAAVNRHLR